MAVEERERQPDYTARPKSMISGRGWFSPISMGELCPPTGLNPVHDCDGLPIHLSIPICKLIKIITLFNRNGGADQRARVSEAWRGQVCESMICTPITPKAG